MIPHKLYINGNVMEKKLELLIFSNLYLNLNVNQSEKIMERPFILPGMLNQALGFNILFTEMRHK